MAEKTAQKEEVLRQITRRNEMGKVIVSKKDDIVELYTPFSFYHYTVFEVEALGKGSFKEGVNILACAGATLPRRNLEAGTERLFDKDIETRMSRADS